MKEVLLTLTIILFSIYGKSQETAPELITDRPDQTESSSVVPLKSLQIETGFVIETRESDLFKQKSIAYNTTLLRYGLFENMELRVGLEYLGERHEIKNTDTVNTISGLSPLYAGFKITIAKENTWMPEIAFLGALVLPFTADGNFKPNYTAANMRFSLSHTISNSLSLGYNLGAEWDGESAIPGYFYSIALGIGLSEKLGMYIEAYGLLPEKGDGEHLADAGFTYLLLPNLQLDISGGLGLNKEAIDNFISFGLSYRLPK